MPRSLPDQLKHELPNYDGISTRLLPECVPKADMAETRPIHTLHCNPFCQSPEQSGFCCCGLANAERETMSTIVFQAKKSSRDYIEATIAPMNRSEEAQFGLIDLLLTAFFLLCAGGLVWLVLAK